MRRALRKGRLFSWASRAQDRQSAVRRERETADDAERSGKDVAPSCWADDAERSEEDIVPSSRRRWSSVKSGPGLCLQ